MLLVKTFLSYNYLHRCQMSIDLPLCTMYFQVSGTVSIPSTYSSQLGLAANLPSFCVHIYHILVLTY